MSQPHWLRTRELYRATPLPTPQNSGISQMHPNAISAYETCYQLERSLQSEPESPDKAKNIIQGRVLGYLVLNADSITALADIVKMIHSCEGNATTLLELGRWFMETLLRLFKKNKGRTPHTSTHPSRRSFDDDREYLEKGMTAAPTNDKSAKDRALIRDRYKSVITGQFDFSYADEQAELGNLSLTEIRKAGSAETQCAHIIPESLFTGLADPEKIKWSASVLAILERHGVQVEEVKGPKVHSLYNVMTMDTESHNVFDRLKLWLEATGNPNEYRVMTTHFSILGEYEDHPIVTFSTVDATKLPVPSPKLLAIHAAGAKVARLSGAAGYFDDLDRDLDSHSHSVLATDGGSSNVLDFALAVKDQVYRPRYVEV